jgi:hypothetical protein
VIRGKNANITLTERKFVTLIPAAVVVIIYYSYIGSTLALKNKPGQYNHAPGERSSFGEETEGLRNGG